MSYTIINKRPEAKTYRVRELVQAVNDGKIRVPRFQRALRWAASDRQLLLDSMVRGFPIGTLLLWKRPATADRVVLGPVVRDVDQAPDALWVVDGQQRLATLASCFLLRPDDPGFRSFAIYFDLDRGEITGYATARREGPRWLPLHRVLDQSDLSAWVVEQGLAADRERAAYAFSVGDALRDYPVPAVLVDTDDEKTLRSIFERTNTSGKRLKASEVFQALHVGLSGETPDTLGGIVNDLAMLGFGRPDERSVREAALLIAGIDPTRRIPAGERIPGSLEGIVQKSIEPIRSTLSFLAEEAGIPSVEFLPYGIVVPALARLFHASDSLHERNRELLARWIWRGSVHEALATNVPRMRQILQAAKIDPVDEAVQTLLSLVPKEPPKRLPSSLSPLVFSRAETKIVLCSMMSSGPANLAEGDGVGIVELQSLVARLDASAENGEGYHGDDAKALRRTIEHLPRIIPQSASSESARRLSKSVANRLIAYIPRELRVADSVYEVLVDFAQRKPGALVSHGFDDAAIHALVEKAPDEEIVRLRAQVLDRQLEKFIVSRAKWFDSDRPPLEAFLKPASEHEG